MDIDYMELGEILAYLREKRDFIIPEITRLPEKRYLNLKPIKTEHGYKLNLAVSK